MFPKRFSLKDKVVVITGASSGIGLALAYEFAKRGAILVLSARSTVLLKEIEADMRSKEYNVSHVTTDVTSSEDCKLLINKTIERHGRIDILINNAGISMRALFAEVEMDVIRRVMDVNFWGTAYCTRYAIASLLESKGMIISIISISGHIGLPARSGYSASKFAVRGLMDAIRAENLHKGLHVLVVAPGFTTSNIRNTALVADGSTQGESPRDEGKMMTAERCAYLIARAAERKKNSLILTFYEGKLAVFLNKWLPRLTTRLTFNHLAKEPNSPFK